MSKWVIIQDARDLPCYRNLNARLVYLHAAMGCDISSYVYTCSLRRLATEVGISYEAVRHALKALAADGLVEVGSTTQPTTQTATQPATQLTTQRTTHLTTIKINKIDTANRTANHATNHATSNATSHATSHDGINNIIPKGSSKTFTLTNARECAGRLKKTAETRFGLAEGVAAGAVNEFLGLKELTKHSWNDEGDMAAHFIAWCEKRLWRLQKVPKSAKSDHDARLAERQRVEEEVAARTPVDQLREEIETLRGWVRQHEKNKNKEMADTMRGALRQKEAELCELTKESGTIPSSHCG